MYFEYYLPHPFRQNVYCLMLNYYQINVTSQLYQWKCDSQQAIVIYNNICKNKYFTQSPKNNYSSFQLNSEIDSLPIASSDLSPINHFSLHLIKSTRILCIYIVCNQQVGPHRASTLLIISSSNGRSAAKKWPIDCHRWLSGPGKSARITEKTYI